MSDAERWSACSNSPNDPSLFHFFSWSVSSCSFINSSKKSCSITYSRQYWITEDTAKRHQYSVFLSPDFYFSLLRVINDQKTLNWRLKFSNLAKRFILICSVRTYAFKLKPLFRLSNYELNIFNRLARLARLMSGHKWNYTVQDSSHVCYWTHF